MTPGSVTSDTQRIYQTLSAIEILARRSRVRESFRRELGILRGAVDHATTERSGIDLTSFEKRLTSLYARISASAAPPESTSV